MNLTLDAVTEQRIQREIDRGHYREPAEVVAHAISLLEEREASLQDTSERSGAQSAQSRSEDVDTGRRAIDAAFGSWANFPEDALEYQQRLRSEWDR